MEREVFPKMDLFPRLAKVGRAIGHVLSGPHLLSPVSEHFQEPRGGGPALDRAMDEAHAGLHIPEWKKNLPPMDYVDPTQHLRVPHDSEGNYHNPDGDMVA